MKREAAHVIEVEQHLLVLDVAEQLLAEPLSDHGQSNMQSRSRGAKYTDGKAAGA
jgi:hypothetical protein